MLQSNTKYFVDTENPKNRFKTNKQKLFTNTRLLFILFLCGIIFTFKRVYTSQ